MCVIPFTFDCIWDIKKISIKELPNDLTLDKNKNLVLKMVQGSNNQIVQFERR